MKIGALIPVRLTSERLPGKALMKVCDRPILAHLLDRVFASRYMRPENVVVCTTESASDDPLEEVVTAAGAKIFRGSTDNIIDRFYKCAKTFSFDAMIQVDGDDPCADTFYMDACVETLLADPALGVVVAEELPLGMGSKAISMAALQTVFDHHTSEKNDTGFGYYFTKTGLCKAAKITPQQDAHRFAGARLTLDYQEDLEFFRALFNALYKPGQVFGINEIVPFLKNYPEVVAINSGLEKIYWQRSNALAQELDYEIDGKLVRVKI